MHFKSHTAFYFKNLTWQPKYKSDISGAAIDAFSDLIYEPQAWLPQGFQGTEFENHSSTFLSELMALKL